MKEPPCAEVGRRGPRGPPSCSPSTHSRPTGTLVGRLEVDAPPFTGRSSRALGDVSTSKSHGEWHWVTKTTPPSGTVEPLINGEWRDPRDRRGEPRLRSTVFPQPFTPVWKGILQVTLTYTSWSVNILTHYKLWTYIIYKLEIYHADVYPFTTNSNKPKVVF